MEEVSLNDNVPSSPSRSQQQVPALQASSAPALGPPSATATSSSLSKSQARPITSLSTASSALPPSRQAATTSSTSPVAASRPPSHASPHHETSLPRPGGMGVVILGIV